MEWWTYSQALHWTRYRDVEKANAAGSVPALIMMLSGMKSRPARPHELPQALSGEILLENDAYVEEPDVVVALPTWGPAKRDLKQALDTGRIETTAEIDGKKGATVDPNIWPRVNIGFEHNQAIAYHPAVNRPSRPELAFRNMLFRAVSVMTALPAEAAPLMIEGPPSKPAGRTGPGPAIADMLATAIENGPQALSDMMVKGNYLKLVPSRTAKVKKINVARAAILAFCKGDEAKRTALNFEAESLEPAANRKFSSRELLKEAADMLTEHWGSEK